MKEKKKTFAISEDRMFSSVLSQNKDLVKLLVETVLGIKIGEVTHIEPQRVMDFETGIRSFRLDVYFEDSNGDAFDVEMETTGSKQASSASGPSFHVFFRHFSSQISKGDEIRKHQEHIRYFSVPARPVWRRTCDDKRGTMQHGQFFERSEALYSVSVS